MKALSKLKAEEGIWMTDVITRAVEAFTRIGKQLGVIA